MAFTRDDIVKDTPTNTFATLNPLAPDTSNMFDMTEGNLRLYTNTPFNSDGRYITTLPFVHTMGKIYFEIAQMTDAISIGFTQNSNYFGIYGNTNANFEINAGTDQGGKVTWQYRSNNGNFPFMNTSTTEVVGLLINFIANEFTIYLATANYTYSFGYNNWINFDSTSDIYLVCGNGGNDGYARFNFGQDPTFANNRVPTKVYTDASGHGRFFYEPPAGAMALCTANLDTANLQPAEYIVDETNQHMLTYNGNAQISKFSPYATDGYSLYSSNAGLKLTDTAANFNYLHDNTSDYTISFWMYRMQDVGSSEILIDNTGGTTAAHGIYFLIDGGGTDKLRIYINKNVGGNNAFKFESDYVVPLRQWVHVSFVFDVANISGQASTKGKLYINGNLYTSGTYQQDGGYSSSDASQILTLGSAYDGSTHFYGYIADFRIVKNKTVYTGNYTPPSSPYSVSETNQDILISALSNGIKDSNTTVTAKPVTPVGSGEVSISDWSPYQRSNDFDTAFFRAKDNYYGGSFKFDGNGDKLDMGDNEDWSLSNGDFTFRFWMYGTNNSITTQHVFAKWNSNKEIRAFFEGSASNRYTTFRFQYKTSSTPQDPWVDGGKFDNLPITPNSWNYFVFVNSGGTTSLYVNGASMTPTNNTISGTIYNSTDSLWIGSSGDANAGFAGHIADFEFEKTAISNPTDVPTNKVTKNSNTKLLLQPWHTKTSAGVMSLIDSYPQDETGKSLTYYNGATIVDISPYKGSNFGSFNFDGTDDYLGLPTLTAFGTNDWTIEFWFKETKDNSGSYHGLIFLFTSTTSLRFQTALYSGTLYFYTYDGNWRDTGWAPTLNKWHHIAITREFSSTTLTFRVDGVQVYTNAIVGGRDYTADWDLNKLAHHSVYTSCQITDLRIIKGQAIYTADFTPPTEPLTQTNETVLLLQPGKVTKRNNVAAQDPDAYMKSVIWTGQTVGDAMTSWDGTTGIIECGFQPDLVWSKGRGPNAWNNFVHDSVRGGGNYLVTNDAGGENTTLPNIVESFNSSGFTIKGNGNSNNANDNYVAWCWKAGGAPGAEDDGNGIADSAKVNGVGTTCLALKNAAGASITPKKMSVNTKAGFSIIKYTGTGNVDSVPHGLSSAPEIVIIKNLDASINWWVYTTVIDGSYDYGVLNLPNLFGNASQSIPTSNVFHQSQATNNNIAYCWHSVAGYSAFGSYTGNGSTDGPFVYTGFKPAWLMIKQITSTSDYTSWSIFDNARDSYNPTNYLHSIYANRFAQEGKRGNGTAANSANVVVIDMLSNGFKPRDVGGTEINQVNKQYIYMAFAEQPGKYSNAR